MKLLIRKVMFFILAIVPVWFLYLINIVKYLLMYRTIFISPKSFLSDCIIGNYVLIGGGVHIQNTSIGDYSAIGGTEGGGIHSYICNADIGKFCSIGPSFKILDKTHHNEYVSAYAFYTGVNSPFFDNTKQDIIVKKVTIGNDVWIGTGVSILGGVKIGDGAIVGAGSMVTKDVVPYSIVAGNPAKILRFRFDNENIQKLLKIKWWNWPINKIRKKLSNLTTKSSSRVITSLEEDPSL